MTWEVEYTDEFEDWWGGLDEDEQERVTAAVEVLEEHGPALGRPLVGTISRSRHPNMKELIPPAEHIRILFAFDPRRSAILLIGGDKTGEWNRWYERMIPVADRLYDEHLDALRREGEIP
ncbi:MAG: type II toxin-antitoxin system RelE/ParE family toxin [Actinomycetota bacterium]|nr:type II toxin-antitoxin system RelE/ParE family toxin [Actinomycetota bacterium]